MTTQIWLDDETFSATPINQGVDRYSDDPQAEIMIRALALDDGPVLVRDLTPGGADWLLAGDDLVPCPPEYVGALDDALADPDAEVWAQNSRFDRTMERKHGLNIPLERWRDTMVQALAHSLPGKLEQLCEALKLPADKAKDKEGKALIRLFCIPQPFKFRKRAAGEKKPDYDAAKAAAEAAWPGRATRESHPAEWRKFLLYAGQDIVAMRAAHKIMPKWNYPNNPLELRLWQLDQRINDRGAFIDMELVDCALNAVDAAQVELAAKAKEMTNGEVESATKRDALIVHILAEYGVDMPDMQASTLERRIADPELPEGLRELLRVRLQASTSSTSKYKTLAKSVSISDSRLRGLLQFLGAARTGRWAGRLLQVQNLPSRGLLKQFLIELAIEAIKGGFADLVFDDVMHATKSTIRGCIAAPPGKKLVVADLSNIEGRDQAWLAGESWKLRAFADFDTVQAADGRWLTGPQYFALCRENKVPELALDAKGEPIRKGLDLYKMSYASSFGIKPQDVTKDQRQVGKVQELACLGPDTLVLTDKKGYIRILDVTTELKVWDGENWVQHKGLISRGEKETINVAGLEVTPDHLILTKQTWLPAQQLASQESMLKQALVTGSVRLPWSNTWQELPFWFSAIVARSRIGSTTTTFAPAVVRLVAHVLSKRPDTGAKTSGPTLISFLKMITAAACWAVSLLASTVAIIRRIAATPITAGAVSSSMNLGAPTAALSSPTSSPWTGGTRPSWSWTVKKWIEATSRAISGLSRTKQTRATGGKSEPCKPQSNGSKKKMQTYDLHCAGPRNRFTILSDRGPLIVHNCGYEGGVGAFCTFALNYGIDLDELAERATKFIPGEVWGQANIMLQWHRDHGRDPVARSGLAEKTWLVCESFKLGWRSGHANIKAYWKELDTMIREAIAHPGHTQVCGKVKIRRQGAWLRIVLPSGRALCYPSPRLEPEKRKKKDQAETVDLDDLEAEAPTGRTKITYMGMNQYTRKWDRLDSYGGKFFENICQAVARDVMAENMPAIEAADYDLIFTVHDEVVCEAPDEPQFNPEHLAALLCAPPPWAPDMPLAAAGFEAYRYKKD